MRHVLQSGGFGEPEVDRVLTGKGLVFGRSRFIITLQQQLCIMWWHFGNGFVSCM